MFRLESVREALTALRANKLRAALTMLGVIIGVSAMVVMVAVVHGFQATVQRQFEGLGSRLIFVFYSRDEEHPEVPRRVDGLRVSDLEAIRERCNLLARVGGEVDLGEVKVLAAGEERTARAKGAEPAYQILRAVHPARGRFLEPSDLSEWRAVCVLGAEIADDLFGDEDPLGQEVILKGTRLTVVGVMQPKGQALGQDEDALVYVPLTTALGRMTGSDRLSTIFAEAHEGAKTEEAMDQMWAVLMRLHDNRADFRVDSQLRIQQTLNVIMLSLSALLSGIAGLSLLVGGIGIMNIMLVSVTERTREIGIRKAVGARRSDILGQFLVEAMTLSGVGGLCGVGLGYLIALLVAAIAGDRLPASVPFWAAALGFAFSVGVGIVAGVYPARRAAQLDPIQALRYE